jgi:CrcB protein
MTLIYVGFGGLMGVLARYALTSLLPVGALGSIFFVNVLGSAVIGYLYKSQGVMHWPMLAIGFCGGFTTFSAFALNSVTLIMNAKWVGMVAYITGTNLCCIGACWLGIKLRSFLIG